jgi:hypothetical protein
MTKNAILLLLLFFSTFVLSQRNTQKGLAALQAHNYGIAASYFQKDLTKSPIAASFGWATYYQTALFYQADSAFSYLSQLEKQLKTCDSAARQKLQADLSFSDTTIAALFTRLALREFQATLSSANLEDFEEFMLRYGQRFPALQAEAAQKRNALSFELAVNAHTSIALAEFLSNYPAANQQKEAQKLLDQLLYQERTQANTEEALSSFITSFPESPYLNEAWGRLYAKYAQNETIVSFSAFINTYPQAPQVEYAWRRIYQLYMQPYSVEKIAQFKEDFPSYPFLADLAQDGELLTKQLYPFLQTGAYGYMDSDGQVRIAAQYEAASPFYDGLSIVAKNNFYGLINKKNEAITPLRFIDISANANGFVLEDSAGFYMADTRGKLLQKEPLQWEELQQTMGALDWQQDSEQKPYMSPYERLERNGKVGINKLGKVILPAKYDEVIAIKGAAFLIAKQGKVLHYFDTTGKRLELNGLEWFLSAPELAPFSTAGYAVFSKAAKLGLMDTKGKVLIKNSYDGAQAVFGGLWPVQQKGKWGLITLDSKVLLPIEQQKILPFAPFGFLVEKERGLGLIDTTGKWLLQPEFNTIKLLESTYFLVENSSGLGLYSARGELLLPCAYQRIVRFDPDTFQLTTSEGLLYYLVSEQKTIGLKP